MTIKEQHKAKHAKQKETIATLKQKGIDNSYTLKLARNKK